MSDPKGWFIERAVRSWNLYRYQPGAGGNGTLLDDDEDWRYVGSAPTVDEVKGYTQEG
jgi:hypothetical protein